LCCFVVVEAFSSGMVFFPFATVFNLKNCTACTRIVLFLSFAIGSTFYILERQHDIWYAEQHFTTTSNTKSHESSPGLVPPIVHYSGSAVGATFLTNYRVARSLLPPTLEPLRAPWPSNKAIVSLVMAKYQNSTIGRYSTVSLIIQAKTIQSPAGFLGYMCHTFVHTYHFDAWQFFCDNTLHAKDIGAYIVKMSSNTMTSQDSLSEIWNYPSYLATIKTDFTNTDRVSVTLKSEFRYELDSNGGSFLPTLTTASVPLTTLSEQRDGDGGGGGGGGGRKNQKKILRTTQVTGHKVVWGGALKLNVLGTGPISNKLKQLKLDQLSPLGVWRTDAVLARRDVGELL